VETPAHNSPEILREEILADARHESEEVIRRAQEQSADLLAKATAKADKVRQDRLEQARAEASRRAESILATVPVEAGRLRSDRVEALLQSVREEILRRLLTREGFEYREAIVELAARAVSQMAGDAFVVKLSPADRAEFGAGLAEKISRRVGRSPLSIVISEDATVTGDGVYVQDTDGRQVWDNRFAARLEQLWPELRRQIAVQTALVATSGSTGGNR
jgi:vacuolar-type H+-ATPase subunit E/Vma4